MCARRMQIAFPPNLCEPATQNTGTASTSNPFGHLSGRSDTQSYCGQFLFSILGASKCSIEKIYLVGLKFQPIHRPFVQNSMLFCSGSNQASVGRRQVHTRVAQSASYSKYSSTTQTQDTHSVAETNCACSRLGWTYMLP